MSTKKKPPKKTAAKAASSAKGRKPTTIDLDKAEKPVAEYAKSMAVVLTAVEKDDRAREAGKLRQTIHALEGKKRAQNEEINAELKKAKAREDQLLACMATGTEDREVKVVVVPDWAHNQMFTVRKDSGDVVDARTMSAEEKGARKDPAKVIEIGKKLQVVADTDKGKEGTYSARDKDKADAKTDDADLTADEATWAEKKDDEPGDGAGNSDFDA